MTNLAKLDFAALDITENNYLEWVLDAEIHLDANSLGDTIKEGNNETAQNKAKAMIFIRRHLHESLKYEYLTIKDSLVLWKNLKERYDHLRSVILPKATYDWIHLRLQDFKSISDYNSALFRIISQLTLCEQKISEENMLEKTFSTFNSSQMLLSEAYRQKGFKKYSKLISCLLVAEQNNEILLKNHKSRPTGTAPFQEVNAAVSDPFLEVNATRYDNSGHAISHGSGRGRGRGNYRGGRGGKIEKYKGSSYYYQNDNSSDNNKRVIDHPCHRCGSKGHWARSCRTPQHLVELYKRSLIENNGKKVEANFVAENENFETNFVNGEDNQFFNYEINNNSEEFLEVSNFFSEPYGKVDHLIGDGSLQKLD